MRFRLPTAFALVGAVSLTLAACSGGGSSAPTTAGDTSSADAGAVVAPSDGAGAVVIATTTQLADIADQVASCNGGSATSLMGVGDDPHNFSPSSQEIAELSRADLVIANGLGLEGGLADALANAADDGADILEIAPLVDPIPFGLHTRGGDDHTHAEDDHAEDTHGEDDHAGHDHSHEGHNHTGDDPHVWHDPDRMAIAAEEIGYHLAESTGDAAFEACGITVAEDLRALSTELEDILSVIPAEQRILVVDHEAWGYFADRYDFEMAGVVIPGGSTEAEPSSSDLAALVDVIKDTGVPAIFANNAGGASRMVEAVAAEVGDIEVVTLFEGSLGDPGSGADTYQDMMRTNAHAIADALQ